MIKENLTNLNEAMSIIWNGLEEVKARIQDGFTWKEEMYERNSILSTKINNSLSEFKQGINEVNLEKDNMLRAINEKSMEKIRMHNANFFLKIWKIC
jgi:hypothetical protein